MQNPNKNKIHFRSFIFIFSDERCSNFKKKIKLVFYNPYLRTNWCTNCHSLSVFLLHKPRKPVGNTRGNRTGTRYHNNVLSKVKVLFVIPLISRNFCSYIEMFYYKNVPMFIFHYLNQTVVNLERVCCDYFVDSVCCSRFVEWLRNFRSK